MALKSRSSGLLETQELGGEVAAHLYSSWEGWPLGGPDPALHIWHLGCDSVSEW